MKARGSTPEGLSELPVLRGSGASGIPGATEAKMATERGATVILSDIIEDQLEATADSLDSDFARLDVT